MAGEPVGPVITVVNDEVRSAYAKSLLQVTRRIQIFESDAVTPWAMEDMQGRLISGDITVDSTRDERRSLNLVLRNNDGALKHDPDNGFWYDKIIKVYRGLKYYDASSVLRQFEIQVGEFMIDNIASPRFPKQTTVSGRDYTKKLLLDEFAVDTSFGTGQNVDDLVKVIATNGGIKKFRLSAGGITVGSAVDIQRNTSRWAAIKQICESQNIEVYFDNEGYLVTRPYDDVSTTVPYYTLSMEESKQNIIDFGKSSSDANIFNHIVVIGTSEEETVTGYRWISVLENNDPSSPTRISRIGRRTFVYEVDYITSQAQADDIAARLMNVKQLEDFDLQFQAVCAPWLEAGRVMEFVDPDETDSVPTRFLYSSFNIPLGLGTMSGVGKRIVIVGQANTSPDSFEVEAA